MARTPLLQLADVTLGLGQQMLFEGLDLVVQPGDRLALIGRNGSGKSTLLRVMAGLIEPDAGARVLPAGISVGYMEQEPDFASFRTLQDFATADLDPADHWQVEAAAEGLRLELDAPTATASGGERRRAALARLLAQAPDLMLIDEPTNHLDITAIEWLEQHLASTKAGFILISHDRAFLTSLARALLWIDRGEVRRMERGFDAFEAWRDKVWAEEDMARHKLDRQIKSEARWAVEGISARRKRNQGRLRALGDLRAERAAMVRRQSTADFALEAGVESGRKVIEAEGISKTYGDRTILQPFDLRILRGERLAIIGPNGAGKTTLVKMLTGELAPDSGSVRLGTKLDLAVFDQSRAALDPDATLWESLTLDPSMAVSGQSDQVMVRGTPRHVIGYLKDFLFDETQARSRVRALSGGERARLLLARIMARQSNLLVLDEPTNDLDIETLDLLQDILGDYAGTVILVSHDRDFLDRIATVTVAMEGDGKTVVYAGGWSDYRRARGDVASPQPAPKAKPKAAAKTTEKPAVKQKLSFTEAHRLENLPAEIEQLSAEISKLEGLLNEPDLYARDRAKFTKASEALAGRQARLAAAEDEWLFLAEKAEG
ncbi:MAG: ABC-F family ATP-binding cassette domain-containing protein [Pseudomonadota bacterium]